MKEQAIGTLGTEGRPPSTAAQVIAFVACAELPQQKWPDAIPSLLAGLDQLPDGSEAPEFQRASVLEAIGYAWTIHLAFLPRLNFAFGIKVHLRGCRPRIPRIRIE